MPLVQPFKSRRGGFRLRVLPFPWSNRQVALLSVLAVAATAVVLTVYVRFLIYVSEGTVNNDDKEG